MNLSSSPLDAPLGVCPRDTKRARRAAGRLRRPSGVISRTSQERLPAILYRVHQIINEPEWFGTSGDHRWDPPAGAPESFGTCYTGTDPLTAFVEAIIELPLLVQSVIDKRAMAVMQVPQDQRLADMSDPKIVGEWGLDRRISVGDDYDVCQRWANALRLAGFTGVFYEPRHDPRGGGDLQSIAFFGDPGYQPTQIQLIEDEPIPRLVVEQAREIFGLRVWPSTPLPPHPLIEFF